MSQEMREIIAQIDFGMEVEAFVQSAIGQYLIKRAESEVEGAVASLKQADPMKPEEIRKLQNEIHRAEGFQYWLAEAIQAGLNAQRELTEEG